MLAASWINVEWKRVRGAKLTGREQGSRVWTLLYILYLLHRLPCRYCTVRLYSCIKMLLPSPPPPPSPPLTYLVMTRIIRQEPLRGLQKVPTPSMFYLTTVAFKVCTNFFIPVFLMGLSVLLLPCYCMIINSHILQECITPQTENTHNWMSAEAMVNTTVMPHVY